MFITMSTLVGLIIACLALGTNGLLKPLIIGGQDAPIELYPYQASLRYEGYHFCNAVIINKRYVITVAQCVYDVSNPYIYSVMVGSDRLDKPGDVYRVLNIIVHNGYNKALHIHDIALIRVTEDIKFNENVQPISLPTVERNYDDYPLMVTGWAKNNGDFGNPVVADGILVGLVSLARCSPTYPDISTRVFYHKSWIDEKIEKI
ncbi:PREDICTED: chymotrypsin-1-like [Dinoponera quadriceps]|uniref:Chymotrypsin-1-like n=1 Tax=Dinoponera quadriceps TaxID=609295 RepID=A0A6P3X0B7_DINQU|nr:PREDICTED: chymotrypsin-1-like [Dinoponera quadriceps]